jgi:hypothetical protein
VKQSGLVWRFDPISIRVIRVISEVRQFSAVRLLATRYSLLATSVAVSRSFRPRTT